MFSKTVVTRRDIGGGLRATILDDIAWLKTLFISYQVIHVKHRLTRGGSSTSLYLIRIKGAKDIPNASGVNYSIFNIHWAPTVHDMCFKSTLLSTSSAVALVFLVVRLVLRYDRTGTRAVALNAGTSVDFEDRILPLIFTSSSTTGLDPHWWAIARSFARWSTGLNSEGETALLNPTATLLEASKVDQGGDSGGNDDGEKGVLRYMGSAEDASSE
ncbi:hypothetical protein BDQ17DRAFT_1330914 [Cyathus striatus]|nr:hypothetical protein BDQ17DRAFT_1330914 [Cyathus striatus]